MAKQYRNQEFIDKIARKISEIRAVKGIVQEDIVDRTGFTQKQVWKILNGKINPTISTIEAVAKALEVHPRELLDFNYDIPKYPPLRRNRKG